MVTRLCYDLEILYNKWSPFVISIILVLYHTCRFLTGWDIEWVQYLCLPSVFTSLHMYNSRSTFKLCKVHRCFVNYVIANVLACMCEHYWVDPYQNQYWFIFVILGTITAMLLAIFYYTEEHD